MSLHAETEENRMVVFHEGLWTIVAFAGACIGCVSEVGPALEHDGS